MNDSFKRQINLIPRTGILPVDKPSGISSFDVIRKLKRFFPGNRIGHAGTLDPAATGLLLVCLGAATKLVEWLQQYPKTYRAEVLFGVITESDDLDGQVVKTNPVPHDLKERLAGLYPEFVGEILQIPPVVSAVKVEGKRAYSLTRAGKPPRLKQRKVRIYSLNEIGLTEDRVVLDIECSTGTYIRSLARDLGERLGSGACLASLRRTSIGPFQVGQAWDFSRDDPEESLIPLRETRLGDSVLRLESQDEKHLRDGLLTRKILSDLSRFKNPPVLVENQTGELVAILDSRDERWRFLSVTPTNNKGLDECDA